MYRISQECMCIFCIIIKVVFMKIHFFVKSELSVVKVYTTFLGHHIYIFNSHNLISHRNFISVIGGSDEVVIIRPRNAFPGQVRNKEICLCGSSCAAWFGLCYRQNRPWELMPFSTVPHRDCCFVLFFPEESQQETFRNKVLECGPAQELREVNIDKGAAVSVSFES